MALFYLEWFQGSERRWNVASTANQWVAWLIEVIPPGLNIKVRERLASNLKHILVGLELKAGLIVPHGKRLAGREVLFEPYFQILNFEFNVGVFSVCEGLGAAHHLAGQKDDGSAGPIVPAATWPPALAQRFDPGGARGLEAKVAAVRAIRDKLHQDRLGLRGEIDWHDFGYPAFVNASETLQILLSAHIERVPPQPTSSKCHSKRRTTGPKQRPRRSP